MYLASCAERAALCFWSPHTYLTGSTKGIAIHNFFCVPLLSLHIAPRSFFKNRHDTLHNYAELLTACRLSSMIRAVSSVAKTAILLLSHAYYYFGALFAPRLKEIDITAVFAKNRRQFYE